jgi:hypothetical protein
MANKDMASRLTPAPGETHGYALRAGDTMSGTRGSATRVCASRDVTHEMHETPARTPGTREAKTRGTGTPGRTPVTPGIPEDRTHARTRG